MISLWFWTPGRHQFPEIAGHPAKPLPFKRVVRLLQGPRMRAQLLPKRKPKRMSKRVPKSVIKRAPKRNPTSTLKGFLKRWPKRDPKREPKGVLYKASCSVKGSLNRCLKRTLKGNHREGLSTFPSRRAAQITAQDPSK